MLSCHACTKRLLQSLVGDSIISSPLILNASPFASNKSNSNRSFTSRSRCLFPNKSADTLESSDPEVSARRTKRQAWIESRGVRPPEKDGGNSEKKDYVMRTQLKLLKDPLRLADHVRKCLKDDEFESTLQLVRAASKDVQCIVSWNHLIDWQLSKGKMAAAFKTYNEMKKRAQVPDAHTYTIIFRGCADHPDPTSALGKVMSLYHVMLSEKSTVKPNTIHLNAILKMCARAHDMDALFAIADDLPPSGVRAANNLTYTTIINAVRQYAILEVPDQTPMQKRNVARDSILHARRMWATITTRWRKGELWIDEELVCAMGRLLNLGSSTDVDDVLSLVEQAMNIPRQVPRLNSTERTFVDPQSKRRPIDQQADLTDSTLEVDGSVGAPAELTAPRSGNETASTEPFIAIAPVATAPKGMSAYAKPGRNSLSVVLEAILSLHLKAPATKYWDIFTKEKDVKPDSDNYHSYMRILRSFRASSDMVQLLEEMPKQYISHKTFRIAMSACERDKLNRHVFKNAGKVLDIMQTNLSRPDIKTLISYLNIAVSSPAYGDKLSSGRADDPNKYAQGQQILRALNRLQPSFINIRALLAYGDTDDTDLKRPQDRNAFYDSVMSLTRSMISANDILMNKALVPREQYPMLVQQRSKLASFVTRYNHISPVRSSSADRSGKRHAQDKNGGLDKGEFHTPASSDSGLPAAIQEEMAPSHA